MRFNFGLKRLLILLGSLTALCIFVIILFSVVTIKGLDDKLIILSSESEREMQPSSGPKLEAGAMVFSSDLENYHGFSNTVVPFKNYVQVLVSEGNVELKNEKIFLLKDISLNSLHQSSCQSLYCYQILIPFKRIPSPVWKGLIGIEDFRFLGHGGVDLISIIRAILIDIKEMRLAQGGSTITQQLSKNLFFSSEKTLIRKLKEVVTSIYLESKFTKDQIVELYLNNVFWGTIGGINLKGIHVASIAYFDKIPSQLSAFESAILISMLKGPNYYNPIRRLERLKKRTAVVVKSLRKSGFFVSRKDIVWKEVDWVKWQDKLKEKNNSQSLRKVWISKSLNQSGLDDYRSYVLTQSAMNVIQKVKSEKGVKVAAKILIKNTITNEQFNFYSNFERGTEGPIQNEKHQIGSTIKPLLYSIFLKLGVKFDDEVSTEPIELSLLSGLWKPKDSSSVEEKSVLVETALKRSLNIPTIRIAQNVGFDQIEGELSSYFKELKTPLKEYPSQLLGAVEISVQGLIDVYFRFLKEQCSIDGSPRVLDKLKDPTQTTIRRAAGDILSGMEFFGKTGTTNFGQDNWFVFYDGVMLGVIWVGVEGDRLKEDQRLYGSSTSFRIFKNFMLKNGLRFNQYGCEAVLANKD